MAPRAGPRPLSLAVSCHPWTLTQSCFEAGSPGRGTHTPGFPAAQRPPPAPAGRHPPGVLGSRVQRGGSGGGTFPPRRGFRMELQGQRSRLSVCAPRVAPQPLWLRSVTVTGTVCGGCRPAAGRRWAEGGACGGRGPCPGWAPRGQSQAHLTPLLFPPNLKCRHPGGTACVPNGSEGQRFVG